MNKEFDYLKEKIARYYNFALAILSGIAGVLYSVVSGDKPFFVLTLGIIGFILFVIIAFRIKKLDREIKQILNQLEEE